MSKKTFVPMEHQGKNTPINVVKDRLIEYTAIKSKFYTTMWEKYSFYFVESIDDEKVSFVEKNQNGEPGILESVSYKELFETPYREIAVNFMEKNKKMQITLIEQRILALEDDILNHKECIKVDKKRVKELNLELEILNSLNPNIIKEKDID